MIHEITMDVVDNHNLSKEKLEREILTIEVKMNSWSRYLRFHIKGIDIIKPIINTNVAK